MINFTVNRRTGKHKLIARAGKNKLRAGAGKYKLRAGGQGRWLGTTNTLQCNQIDTRLTLFIFLSRKFVMEYSSRKSTKFLKRNLKK